MGKSVSSLTVFFEDPFWVGVFERHHNGEYEASRTVFGQEPKDAEVYEFMLKSFDKLKFSPAIEVDIGAEKSINPKRRQRLINKQLSAVGVGTKAQQALKLQYEQSKLEKKSVAREERDNEKERRYQLHIETKKEKHRGH